MLFHCLLSAQTEQQSQTHIYENSQANKYESSQANTAQQVKPRRKEYEHDTALDEFKGFFSASVSRSADRDYVTIRWQDGRIDQKPLSEKQASWYAHAGSDLERQDIATKLALSAFSREVYDRVRDHYIDEYEKGRDVSGYIDFDKCSVYKHKDGSYRVRVSFNGVMANDTYQISNEDVKAYVSAAPDKERQMVSCLAMKYLREEDGCGVKQDLRYDDIFDYDSRKEKTGLAMKIAKGVRAVKRTAPGTVAHANAVTRQLCIATSMLRSIVTARGGAGDENREDELRKGNSYEGEVAAEGQMTL